MRSVVLGLAIVLGVAGQAAAQSGPSKCTAAKTKALGAYAQQLAACRAKAVAKGVAIDAACTAKARAKLEKAFEKAEKRDDCLETDDDAFAAREAAAFVAGSATVLEDQAICCGVNDGGNACLYVTDALECELYGGAVGAAGSVCNGSGTCTAGPATGSSCCEDVPEGNGCITPADGTGCTLGGGTFLDGGFCLPTGKCRLAK
jgi:hypothetical protein